MRLKLSQNGPTLSQLSFGVWRLRDQGVPTVDEIKAKVDTCLEAGITTFDHADIYGDYLCEETFGGFLKENPSYKDKIEIVTKCGIALLSDNRPEHTIKHYNYSKEHIRFSVENSLKNLNADKLDVVLFHRPSPLLNPLEVAEVCEDLKKEGKVLHFGVSNFTPAQFSMLNKYTELVTNQVEASPVHLTPYLDGTFDQCLEFGMAPMIWSPTGGGRIFHPKSESEKRVFDKLTELSSKYDTQIDILIYSWLLSHPSRPNIVLGTNNLERIQRSTEALEIKLELQDWFEIWQACTGEEVP